MLICPNCKILYERSTNCIKCGSPLVEKGSSEKEEIKAPPQPEINKEIPSIQKSVSPPISKPKIEKEKTKTGSISDTEKAVHEVLTDEQSSSDISSRETKREVSRPSRPKETQIRIPALSFQKVSILIVILIGVYLLWSIYSYFTAKKPGTDAPPSKETASLLPSPPATSTKPRAPLKEPKIANNEKSEKKPPVSEKGSSVSPSVSSIPIVSKTPVSDEKEIENIKNLFENIRKANLQKNIDLFLSCYSMAFKDREGKKKETIKNFENFNYINLSYNMTKHSISGDTAMVRIEWLIQFSPKAGGQTQKSKILLDVNLNKESGGWKIKNIKTIS
jgi:ketosteroid isomerase-like protein